LYPQVPPYPWIFRDTSNPDHFLLAGTTQISATVQLNTVYTTLPFSPNGGTGTATTKNNGNPHVITTAETVCIDSPENTDSFTAVNTNPPLLGDTGPGCSGVNCADAEITGPWTSDTITGTQTVTVSANYLDRGPNAGNFTAHWDVELTDPDDMTAVWSNSSHVKDVAEALTPSVNLPVSQDLTVTCTGTGEGLVVIKNVLWPVAPTTDYYPADNATLFVTKVVCNGGVGSPLVDKQVVEVVPTGVSGTTMASTPYQVNLVTGGASALLTMKVVTANNSTTDPAAGVVTLSAEAAPTAPTITRTWDTSTNGVTFTPAFASPQLKTGVDCSADGASCINFSASEPKGQATTNANLTLSCPGGMAEGRYSVVVKAIDAPGGSLGESNASDNAGRFVVMVNCWTTSGDMHPDGIDDGTGLYARWAIFQSNPDARMTFQNQPSFPSDQGMDSKLQNPTGGYIERTLDLECFWHSATGVQGNGAADTLKHDATTGDIVAGSDGEISAAESHADPTLVAMGGYAAIDADGDCLVDQGLTGPAAPALQPGHPVDLPAVGGTCPTFPWAGPPEQAPQTYSVSADHDCDGVPDGVEVAYGSNPMLADSDSDGATDYVEMFQFTNPNNPDTDGDGYLDKPSGVFGDNTGTIGTADAAVTSTSTTLTDTRQSWTANQFVGNVVTCNGRTMTVTSNTATTLTGASWSNGGNPGSGNAYILSPGLSHSQDNCPTVANADQKNSDSKHRITGIVSTDPITTAATSPLLTDTAAPGWTVGQWNGQSLLCLQTNGTIRARFTVTSNTANTLSGAAWIPGAGQAAGAPASCPGGFEFTMISSGKAGNPNKDKMGDACDPDNDNDGVPDVSEVVMGTDPFNADTNGNHCEDGPEVYLGLDPATTGHNCPGTLTSNQKAFFRACFWNLPPKGTGIYGGLWDNQYSAVTSPRQELDPDGDGRLCTTNDFDNDNGTGTLTTAPSEVTDVTEIMGFNTNPTMKDTDGDGCTDRFQINDVDGNGAVDNTDLLAVATAINTHPNAASNEILDVDKSNAIDNTDLLQVASNLSASAPGYNAVACANGIY
jgi:hypothetical protein